jgi:WD40 repeat protein
VAFSPDGRLGAWAFAGGPGESGGIRVWEVTTGRTVAVLRGDKEHKIRFATFSPDGRRLLTRPWWDPILVEALGNGRQFVLGMVDNADVADGTVACLWDVANGKRLRTLARPQGDADAVCTCAVFSPDGRRVLTGHESETGPGARVWDAETGELLLNVGEKEGPVDAVDFSPDGRRLLTAHRATAYLWDADSGRKLVSLPAADRPFFATVFSPDGRHVLTVSWDESRVLDAASGATVATLREPGYQIKSAQFSPDNRWVLATLTVPAGAKPPPGQPVFKARLCPVDPVWAADERRPRDLTAEERQRFEIPPEDP